MEEKKSKYVGKFNRWKKHTRLFTTSEKVKGFIVACDKSRDPQSISEITALLTWYSLKFLPELKETFLPRSLVNLNRDQHDKDEEKEEKKDEEEKKEKKDEDESEESESEEESSETLKPRKRFELINSACAGLYVIHLVQEDVNPADFIYAIIVDLHNRFKDVHNKDTRGDGEGERFATVPPAVQTLLDNAKKDEDLPAPIKGLFNIRYTSRLIPFQRATAASLPEMLPVLTPMIQAAFENDTTSTFNIDFRTRNNLTCDKMESITTIAKMVSNKVDLSNPDITIVIEICKSAACMSVVRNYRQFYRFNIREAIYGNPERHQINLDKKNKNDDTNHNNQQPTKKQKK